MIHFFKFLFIYIATLCKLILWLLVQLVMPVLYFDFEHNQSYYAFWEKYNDKVRSDPALIIFSIIFCVLFGVVGFGLAEFMVFFAVVVCRVLCFVFFVIFIIDFHNSEKNGSEY